MSWVNRLLHPVWRWRARRTLRSLTFPRRFVFICHGNVCRSPYAAAAFEALLAPSFRAKCKVGSAGLVMPGRRSPSEAIEVARRHRVDLAPHRSQLVSRELLLNADLTIVMEPAQRRSPPLPASPGAIVVLGDLDSRSSRRRIRDPMGQSEAMFEEVYTRIDRCLAELATELEIPVRTRGGSGGGYTDGG